MNRSRILFLFLFLCYFTLNSKSAQGLEAMIQVLEAPVFSQKNKEATVVEYRKKGDIIKVFPSLDLSYDPSAMYQTEYVNEEFIPVIDKRGQLSFMLSEHLFIFFEDSREFQQKTPSFDPTDYRLSEPLPKNYPFKKTRSLRSQIGFGINHFIFENYPYPEDYSKKGFVSQYELSYSIFKVHSPRDIQHFFLGGHLSYKKHSNTFYFSSVSSKREAREEGHKFAIGPSFIYDFYKRSHYDLSLGGHLSFIFYETLSITQKTNREEENKKFWGQSLSFSLIPQVQFKNFWNSLDLILGGKMEYSLGSYLRNDDVSTYPTWWRSRAEESFWTRPTVNLGLFLSLQSFD